MPKLIRAFDNRNTPIVNGSSKEIPTRLIYFNLVRLNQGQSFEVTLDEYESVSVVLSGACDIAVGDTLFDDVGKRPDVWSGPADSVYAPPGARIRITGLSEQVEVALAGGYCTDRYLPFRIHPEQVDMVDVGSPETKSRRRIFHVLGANGTGRAGNLLVSELYADEGCWSGYPPHKHDSDRDGETAHEEVYYFKFRPETGFGAQYAYDDGGEPSVVMTRDGDVFATDRGYHPTVTSPGHEEYIFTILVGRSQRPLVQFFEPQHRHLMDRIPGIAAMRAKFLA